MKRPYNKGCRDAISSKKGGKKGLLFLLTTLIVAGISCGKGATTPEDHSVTRPATEAIAEADQLYSGRPDLVKVREGIVALRQAQAEDQSNYELAWRLAKFNYYLGAHSPEHTEQDKA